MSTALTFCKRKAPQFWLNLQSAYELRRAEKEHGKEIARLPVRAGANTGR
jgi:plasmid maintenance system antidote protein VapI